jgi:hypothetical protein
MAYRSFSTNTWQDPWFESLSFKAKLLFIYLWTNDVCNQAGLYQVSMRRVEFETGLKPAEIISELYPKIEWFKDQEIVWVKNFFRKQCANEKFALAAIRSLHCIPQKIVEKFTQYNLEFLEKYGIDTVSVPYKTEFDTLCESVTGTDTDTDTDTVPDTVPPKPPKGEQIAGFEEFWNAYPRKIGKQEAMKAWQKHNGKRPELSCIISKLEELKKTEQWSKDGGTYIPYPARWINRGGWHDESSIKTAIPKIKYRDPIADEEAIYGKS